MFALRRLSSAVVASTATRRAAAAPAAVWRRACRASSSFQPSDDVPAGRASLLFTPGPLTTSHLTKQAMLHDMGTRDSQVVKLIADCRAGILDVAGVTKEDGYESVIVQGAGTMAVEAALTTGVSRDGKVLVVCNGHYGDRMYTMLQYMGVEATTVKFAENVCADPDTVLEAVRADPDITHVAMVHHETTSGAISDVASVGKGLREINPDITFIVDSMSAFGAYPVDLPNWNIHYLVSSANKCIEGVPGFAFVVCNRERLQAAEGNARSLSLDLVAQWKSLEAAGQFRFTPPVQAMLAFRQALKEYFAEGGREGRLARYDANFAELKAGMTELGFSTFVDDSVQASVISTFLFPDDPNFDLPTLYTNLAKRGMLIYPGKVTKADCFRVGSIGRLFPSDMRGLVLAIRDELTAMGVKLPVTQIKVADE